MAISDTLKQKAGPLPVWAWGALLGVVIVAGMYWYSSRSAVTSAGETGELIAYPDLDGGAGDGSGSSSTPQIIPGNVGSGGVPEFSGNTAWLTYCVAALIRDGYSPLTVQLALSKYLKGGELNGAEQQIVNLALSRYGLPPNGTDQTPTVTPTTPVTTTPDKPVPDPAPPVTGTTPTYTNGKATANYQQVTVRSKDGKSTSTVRLPLANLTPYQREILSRAIKPPVLVKS